MKTYLFNMTVSANDDVSQDEILDKLVELAEANGWQLGGGLIEFGLTELDEEDGKDPSEWS